MRSLAGWIADLFFLYCLVVYRQAFVECPFWVKVVMILTFAVRISVSIHNAYIETRKRDI